jgi:hypothetical protein
MSNVFSRIDAPALTNSAGTGVLFTGLTTYSSNILFSGTVCNTDDTNQATHYINLQVVNAGGSKTTNILHKIPVPYGSTMDLPKIVIGQNEELIGWADVAGVLDLDYNVVSST